MLLKHEDVPKLLGKVQGWAGAQFCEGKIDIIESESSWCFQNNLRQCDDKYWLLFVLDIWGKVSSLLFVSFQTLDVFDCSVSADNGAGNNHLQWILYSLTIIFWNSFFLSLGFMFKYRIIINKPFPKALPPFPNLSICHILFIETTYKYRESNGLDSHCLNCGSKWTHWVRKPYNPRKVSKSNWFWVASQNVFSS